MDGESIEESTGRRKQEAHHQRSSGEHGEDEVRERKGAKKMSAISKVAKRSGRIRLKKKSLNLPQRAKLQP